MTLLKRVLIMFLRSRMRGYNVTTTTAHVAVAVVVIVIFSLAFYQGPLAELSKDKASFASIKQVHETQQHDSPSDRTRVAYPNVRLVVSMSTFAARLMINNSTIKETIYSLTKAQSRPPDKVYIHMPLMIKRFAGNSDMHVLPQIVDDIKMEYGDGLVEFTHPEDYGPRYFLFKRWG
jgi:hypothetical protein